MVDWFIVVSLHVKNWCLYNLDIDLCEKLGLATRIYAKLLEVGLTMSTQCTHKNAVIEHNLQLLYMHDASKSNMVWYASMIYQYDIPVWYASMIC